MTAEVYELLPRCGDCGCYKLDPREGDVLDVVRLRLERAAERMERLEEELRRELDRLEGRRPLSARLTLVEPGSEVGRG
jgi:hypothetical protein